MAVYGKVLMTFSFHSLLLPNPLGSFRIVPIFSICNTLRGASLPSDLAIPQETGISPLLASLLMLIFNLLQTKNGDAPLPDMGWLGSVEMPVSLYSKMMEGSTKGGWSSFFAYLR